MNKPVYFLGGVATALTLSSHAATTVFQNDFNGALPSEITGVASLESVQGFAGLSGSAGTFGGNLLRNTSLGGSTVLTLSGLPSHTAVDVGFLLGVMDSWDGASGGFAPDNFNVNIDGTPIQASFDIFASGDQVIPSGFTQLSYNDARGFNSGFNDASYDVALSIPHTGSSLTISFFSSGSGFQGGDDESWGIDNLKVSLEGVPSGVPDAGGTLLILSTAVGALSLLRRRN